MPRFLKCIFVLSSEFPEHGGGWTYNMSHERVSTLFPSPVRYPASPFFETACPSYARVFRSLCLVRQVSRASSYSTKCSLTDPNSPFSSRSVERNSYNHYNPPAELVSPSTSIRDFLRSRDNIFEICIYAKNHFSYDVLI